MNMARNEGYRNGNRGQGTWLRIRDMELGIGSRNMVRNKRHGTKNEK